MIDMDVLLFWVESNEKKEKKTFRWIIKTQKIFQQRLIYFPAIYFASKQILSDLHPRLKIVSNNIPYLATHSPCCVDEPLDSCIIVHFYGYVLKQQLVYTFGIMER